jgi:Domain of unknown function (DUF4326)
VSTPKRIQRRRTKGWRMPAGAVYVGRPSQWGNPFVIARTTDQKDWVVTDTGGHVRSEFYPIQTAARAAAVRLYRLHSGPLGAHELDDDEVKFALAGKDLVCWCPLDQPCHADVLLELANRP